MNRKPNTSGIDKRWKEGDGRVRLAELLFLNPDSGHARAKVDGFLEAFRKLVWGRRRTVIVGFGTFEWRKWKNRIPTGERVETWRLAFKPGQHMRRREWK